MPVEDDNSIDVFEMFGGDGNTTWILYKKHGCMVGWNFDLTVGIDLTSKRDVELLWMFMQNKKPKVVILALPCRCYSSLSALNKVINFEGWERSFQVDKVLVLLASQIAAYQASQGNHFVIEQPAGSRMFQSKEWCSAMKGIPVHECVFDQCMTVLLDSPTRNPLGC